MKKEATGKSKVKKQGKGCDLVSDTIKAHPLKSVGITALLVFLLF